jgi:hypothetical protein
MSEISVLRDFRWRMSGSRVAQVAPAWLSERLRLRERIDDLIDHAVHDRT